MRKAQKTHPFSSDTMVGPLMDTIGMEGTNGPGIRIECFERILQMFQTLAPKNESDSTGIGHALVKRMVETYGGTVWVEYELGQGSTFFSTVSKHNGRIRHAEVQSSTVS